MNLSLYLIAFYYERASSNTNINKSIRKVSHMLPHFLCPDWHSDISLQPLKRKIALSHSIFKIIIKNRGPYKYTVSFCQQIAFVFVSIYPFPYTIYLHTLSRRHNHSSVHLSNIIPLYILFDCTNDRKFYPGK